MPRSRSVLVLLVALVLSVFFAVPVEDDPETTFDESESLLYVSASVFSMAAPEAMGPAPTRGENCCPARTGYLKGSAKLRFDRRTEWSGPIRGSLTILDHSFRC